MITYFDKSQWRAHALKIREQRGIGKLGAGRVAALVISGFLTATGPARGAATISLGTAQDFSVLGGSTVTNTGPTVITGNVGVSPGTAITGFPPGIVTGTIHAGDAVAAQAKVDASSAYGQLTGEASSSDLSGVNLGGLTLTPGVYHFANTAQLSGTLTLNTEGNPNAAFHFQIGSTVTTSTGSSVVVLGLNGASDPNVFWQVGSSATLGIGSAFDGNIIALTSITLNTGASIVDGRALALNGSVTLDTNSITPPMAPAPPGNFWKGSASNLWSGANWSTDATGATSGTLAPLANVVFSVTGVPPQNENSVLDVNATIASLTVNDPSAVTISGAHLLSIVGTGATRGITIGSGAGLVTIDSALDLGALSQAVTVNNAAGLIVNGSVSGANGLAKEGAGQLTLAGANTYTGATTISAGALRAGATDVIPDKSAVTVAPGALLNLNGFAQSIGSLAGAGAVGLGGAALVTGQDNQSTVYAGSIGGAGSITKVGSGTWDLTGSNVSGGPAIVKAGTLQVDGSIAGDATVAGGILAGTGRIAGSVVNNAAVHPGSAGAPGTLMVGGNFDQRFPGTLGIRLASPGDYDKLTIGGSATLSGALSVSYLGGFKAKPGEEFQILTAAGGVSGRFASVNDVQSTGTALNLGVVYHRDAVLLEFVQGSFAALAPSAGFTPNELAVAEALDKLAADRPGNKLVQHLDTLPLSQVAGALSLLSPEDLGAIFTAGLSFSHVQADNLERRLEEARGGSTGFSDSGFAVSDSHGARNYEGKDVAGTEAKESKEAIAPAREGSDRWGFFISGTGEWGDLDSTGDARGSSFTTGGVTIGADYRIGSHFVLGAAIGYANTSSSLSRGGDLDIDSGRGSLYATYFSQGFYVNGIAGAGYSSLDSKRRAIDGYARGETDGADFSGLIGAGYDYHVGGISIGPVASLEYGSSGIDGFMEHGALGALQIDSQNQNSLLSEIGLRAACTHHVGRITITPEVRAQWEHEYLTGSSGVDAGFGSGGSFTVHGPPIGRDGVLLDIGASAQLTPAVAIFAYYFGELGRENYTVQSVNGGVRVSF